MKPIIDWTDRELNDFLAEKVMGWVPSCVPYRGKPRLVYLEKTGPDTAWHHIADDWCPSRNLSIAGEVLAKLCEQEVVVRTERIRAPAYSKVHVHSIYQDEPVGIGLAFELPQALARAMVDYVLKTEDRMEPDE